MVRFQHISDVHIGYEFHDGLQFKKDRKDDILSDISRVVEKAKEAKTDFLLISGDLFDNPPTVEELKMLDAFFMPLKDTAVIYCQGKKDFLDRDCPLAQFTFHSNVYVIGAEKFRNGASVESPAYGVRSENATAMLDVIHFAKKGVDIYGVGCYSKKNSMLVLEDEKPFDSSVKNILVAYGGEHDGIRVDFGELRKSGFDYVALGSEHNFRKLYNGCICYAGSLEPLSDGETGLHGYIDGLISDEGIDVRLVSASTRQYKTIEYPVSRYVSDKEISQDIIRFIKNEGKNNIYTIRLVRLDHCEKNFYIEDKLQQYHINAIEGEIFDRKNYDEYIKANANNRFGFLLEKLNDASPTAGDGAKLMIDTIIEMTGINYRHSKRLTDRQLEDVREQVIDKLSLRKKDLSSSPEVIEYQQVMQKLEVNPDILDKLNAAWADERKAELELRAARNNLSQIPSNHRNRWIKIGIRTAIVPFFFFCFMLIVWTPYGYMKMMNNQTNINFAAIILMGTAAIALTFFLGYIAAKTIDYHKAEQMSSKKSGIKHEMRKAEDKCQSCQEEVDRLRDIRRKYQLLESRRKEILEDVTTKESKVEAIYYEIKIIEEALNFLDEEMN